MLVITLITINSRSLTSGLLQFSYGGCSKLHTGPQCFIPLLLLRSGKLPLFLCFWFLQRYSELINHADPLWLPNNLLECHVPHVLSTFPMCEDKNLLQAVWHIMDCSKCDHFITKSLELGSNICFLHLSCPCWKLIPLNDPLRIFLFQKISLGPSKSVDWF